MASTISALMLASVFVWALGLNSSVGRSAIIPEVIYGFDSRLDLYELSIEDEKIKHLARSTAILNFKSKISSTVFEGVSEIQTSNLSDIKNVCTDEPYAEQKSGGWCTGFLVGEDTMVTAGHCIDSQESCDNTVFIFDYGMHTEDEETQYVKNENIYSCQKLLKQEYGKPNGVDFAIIKLNKKVEGREPLVMRSEGIVDDKADLKVIGHPLGLPTKIALGSYVRNNDEHTYFEINSDTFSGNSGSPVFNEHGVVEGVLVRGERDFVYKDGCMVSNYCKDDECRGEDVVRATVVNEFLSF